MEAPMCRGALYSPQCRLCPAQWSAASKPSNIFHNWKTRISRNIPDDQDISWGVLTFMEIIPNMTNLMTKHPPSLLVQSGRMSVSITKWRQFCLLSYFPWNWSCDGKVTWAALLLSTSKSGRPSSAFPLPNTNSEKPWEYALLKVFFNNLFGEILKYVSCPEQLNWWMSGVADVQSSPYLA